MRNNNDHLFMKRCLELASLGLGNAAPNPMVGSVIVYNDEIIGEGYHHKCGLAHAEVNAINSVKDISLLNKSALYVNLEPCSHFGKTPPCADLIIEKQIPKVVIACIDNFEKVSGKGIEKLKKAGCQVEIGIMEKESRELNRRFFTFHEKKRPYIILKWAQTLDGFIDMERKPDKAAESYWITNKLAKMMVHKWRTEESAFMVGANTVLNDNPLLTVRDWVGRNPVRIVFDKDLSLPKNSNIFNNEAKTFIFNFLKNDKEENIEYLKIDNQDQIPEQILDKLYQAQIQSVVVEGGQRMLRNFIQKNLWDEARIFTGNKYFTKGMKAPEINGHRLSEINIGDSKLLILKNT